MLNINSGLVNNIIQTNRKVESRIGQIQKITSLISSFILFCTVRRIIL